MFPHPIFNPTQGKPSAQHDPNCPNLKEKVLYIYIIAVAVLLPCQASLHIMISRKPPLANYTAYPSMIFHYNVLVA